MRQVYDANLSDIEEDNDDFASISQRAPGKENDARPELLKSKDATSSMLKNRSFKTKASSDTSSDGNATVRKLKEMHLEADKTLSFGAKAGEGGARLSVGSSYKPPSVESAASACTSVVGGVVKTYHVSHHDTGHLARASGNGDLEMKDAGFDTVDKACQADISSTIRLYPSGPENAASPNVHQSDSGSRPTTCGTNGSAVSRGFPSGTSRTSAASMRFRARRNPAETSTGSPPERDGLAVDGNIGDKLRYKSLGSGAWAQQPIHNGAHEMPAQESFGATHQFCGMAGGYANGQGLPDLPIPPTPPTEDHWPHTQQQYQNLDHDRYMMNQHDWVSRPSSPSAPMAYGANMNLGKPDGYEAHHGTGGFGFGSGAEYATHPGYYNRPQNGFKSAAHFSDAHCRRDFSGDSYYDPPIKDEYEYNKPSYSGGGFGQPQQSYQSEYQDEHGSKSQYGPQPQYGTQSKYGAQTQYGFQGQPGGWSEYQDNGFTHQGPAFEDSGYSAPKEFDFSFIGQGNNSEWAANAYVPTHEEINAYMERNCANPGPQMATAPRAEPQWTIYEDKDDGAAAARGLQQGDDIRAAAYAWRDGKTSVHHVSSSTPGNGNTVTILSIREITSDEDLSGKFRGGRGGGDDDDGTFWDP